uniref:hypothetical protein n=1 Tax=Aquitalea magnusonii TaxID=332411 RepID=UPI001379AAA6
VAEAASQVVRYANARTGEGFIAVTAEARKKFWLIAVSGSAAAPALYLTATGLLAVLGMALMPEGRGRKLEH